MRSRGDTLRYRYRVQKEYAKSVGIRLERPESLNASLTLARAISGLAIKGLIRLKESESPIT